MKLRYYQQEAIDALYAFFTAVQDPNRNPVIALPTGTGKSVVIAGFIAGVLKRWPNQRIMMITHVKELIAQNADKMLKVWPQAPLGIFSSGLKIKQAHMPITFGGIQSAIKSVGLFGKQDILIIDECHLVGTDENASYLKFIGILKQANPYLRVIGLSATPYRLGLGMITDGGIFTDVIYDATGLKAFNRLLDEGYLAPLIPMPTETVFDLAGVKIRGGEYVPSDVQKAMTKRDLSEAAAKEILVSAQNRHAWLIFTTGVEHAEMMAEILRRYGVPTGCVHSKMKGNREDELDAFDRGQYRALVNSDILTTGYDKPDLDCIIDLKPTQSPGLHVQKLGRGTRPYYADGFDLDTTEGRLQAIAASMKQNCIAEGELVLTDKGLVPIEDITLEMRVWDGVQFVEHCGTVFRGKQKVIEYAGLKATTDHKVWTKEGWKTFGECALKQIAIAVTGADRQNIQQSADIYRNGNSKRGSEQSAFRNNLQKMQRIQLERLSFFDVKQSRLPKMRQSKKRPKMACKQGNRSQATLYKPKRSCVGTLWGKRNRVPILITNRNGCLGTRKFRSAPIFAIGPDQKQRALRTGKFAVRSSRGEPIKHPLAQMEYSTSSIQIKTSRSKICRCDHKNFALERVDFQRNRRPIFQSAIKETERKVWDIINAGPRNRFTVNGLLVSNCLVLDFAGNTRRCGPINAPRLPKKKGEGTGDIPVKACKECGCLHHISARFCINCEAPFTFTEKIEQHASTLDVILRDEPKVEVYKVDRVTYARHARPGHFPSLRVTYHCGLLRFTDYVCIEHPGNIRFKAQDWWRRRTKEAFPASVAEAQKHIDSFPIPEQIRVWVNTKFPKVLHEFFIEDPKDATPTTR